MKPLFSSLLIAGLALALTGCEVGADYKPPEPVIPADWASSGAQTISPKAKIDQTWWANFNDPVLTRLIDKAAADNLDLKIAEARIAEARAGVAEADAALLPSGDVKGTATREANQMAMPGGNSNPFSSLLHKPFNLYQTGFDASWEMDLFGGNRRAEEAAKAQMQASEASRDDARVSLLAEVARDYVAVRAAQAQLSIAEAVFAADRKTLDIARQRFEAGEASRLDVTQADAVLEHARTQIPTLRNQIAQSEFSLDVLLGAQPGTARGIVGAPAPVPVSDKKLVLAAPASVIAQRPDIRVAERKLAAATAQQGAALAKFFPDISLSGFFGALNTSTSKLVTGGNQSWVASGSVLWPILSYNSLSANLHTVDAQQQEALASYQKTVLSALSDVERSLSAYTQQENFLQASASEVKKTELSRAIAKKRFQEGETSRLAVLDADRALYDAQTRLIEARAEDSQNLIAVYKSLGGGWVKG